MRVLWLGAGDLAVRTLPYLAASIEVIAVKRQPANWPGLAVAADLHDSASLSPALALDYQAVVITLTPGERSESAYRALFEEALASVVVQLRAVPIIFVSSTSVYAQNAGEIIDEQAEAIGSGFSGRSVRAAELLLGEHSAPVCMLRCSGIYGRPGRLKMLADVREQRCDLRKAAHWTNRIHADDVARAIAFLLARVQRGAALPSCVLASDPVPVMQGELWNALAHMLELPPVLDAEAIAAATVSGKRCNSALLQSLGFTFAYPDYRAGYRPLIAGAATW